MGKMSREKGKRFERKIADQLRRRFPQATIRRANQTQQAYQSDVFFELGPAHLRSCWFECNDSRYPNPVEKMAQAERDISLAKRRRERLGVGSDLFYRTPIVVWHKYGARDIWATLYFHDLATLQGVSSMGETPEQNPLVSILWDDLVDILAR